MDAKSAHQSSQSAGRPIRRDEKLAAFVFVGMRGGDALTVSTQALPASALDAGRRTDRNRA
jgi:hypothetical protein